MSAIQAPLEPLEKETRDRSRHVADGGIIQCAISSMFATTA